MMHLNIFHRPESGANFAIFERQQDMVHGYGLKSTIMIHYRDLFDSRVVDRVRRDSREFGDEIGLALHRLTGPDLPPAAQRLEMIWLQDEPTKRQILTCIIRAFRETFGKEPSVAGSYHLDASSLRILKELAPGIRGVIGGCFEEGVRVYHGCNHSWHLFNEGMPWGPWYPAKDHSLRPACDETDWVGVVAVPHLSRDMSLAYEGRNDFWASHPPNVIRGMGNEATWCPYDLNLIDQYRLQAKYNGGFCYYNTFVSAAWLTWNHNSEYPPEVSWELYRKQMDYFKQLKLAGELEDMTLGEYSDWHRANHPIGGNEVYWAREMLYGSGKHYAWHIDSNMRVLIDATQGGSIGDLRPYAGHYAVSTGPDTPHKQFGSYPYLIQSQHRTGFPHHHTDGTRTTLKIRIGEREVDLASCRTKVSSISRDKRGVTIRLTPANVTVGEKEVRVSTEYLFPGDSTICITRNIELQNDVQTDIQVEEYVKLGHGITEYPMDMNGVLLRTIGGSGEEKMPFTYNSNSIGGPTQRCAVARFPLVGTDVELSSIDGPVTGAWVDEGHLFGPYVTLRLIYTILGSGKAISCLKLNRIV